MELVFDKRNLIEERGKIPDEFYEEQKEQAVTLISLSIIRELKENGLLTQEEFDYLFEKYNLE